MTQILKHVDCCGFDIRKPVWVPHRNFSNIHLNSFLDYKRKLLAQHAKWGTNIGCLRRVPDRHHWMRSSVRSLRRSPSMWWWRARRNCLNTQRSSFCLNRKCYSLWPRNPKQYMIPHMSHLQLPQIQHRTRWQVGGWVSLIRRQQRPSSYGLPQGMWSSLWDR